MTRPNFLPRLFALLLPCSSPACQAQASPHPQAKEQIAREFALTAQAGRSTHTI